MTGCATTSSLNPMPEENYSKFSGFAAALRYCFEKEHISPQLYADAKNSYSQALNTWNWDQNRLSSMMDAAYNDIGNSNSQNDAGNCRQIEAHAYELISKANQHRADRNQQRADQRQSQEDLNETLREINRNKPIYCNTIGTMTLCN